VCAIPVRRDHGVVGEFIQIQAPETSARPSASSKRSPALVLWLQGITLAWMLVECAFRCTRLGWHTAQRGALVTVQQSDDIRIAGPFLSGIFPF
jgi:hypothetical protein